MGRHQRPPPAAGLCSRMQNTFGGTFSSRRYRTTCRMLHIAHRIQQLHRQESRFGSQERSFCQNWRFHCEIPTARRVSYILHLGGARLPWLTAAQACGASSLPSLSGAISHRGSRCTLWPTLATRRTSKRITGISCCSQKANPLPSLHLQP